MRVNIYKQSVFVFFVYNIYYRYNEQLKKMEGSPILTEQEWPGIPTPIDAAVFYEGYITHRIFFYLQFFQVIHIAL